MKKLKEKPEEQMPLSLNYFLGPFVVLFNTFKSYSFPMDRFTYWVLPVSITIATRIDIFIFKKLGIHDYYPYHPVLFWIYCFILLVTPICVWCLVGVCKKRGVHKKLRQSFINSGLQSNLGDFPKFISDEPLEAGGRKLVLSSSGIAYEKFKKSIDSFQSNLGIFIDGITQEIEKGRVNIFYSLDKLTKYFEVKEVRNQVNYSFLVGISRVGNITANLRKQFHLLIGGESGGGKSSYMRYLITTLLLNQESRNIVICDLKGEGDYTSFQNIDGVKLFLSPKTIVSALEEVEKEMQLRSQLLQKTGCENIDVYNSLPKEKKDSEVKLLSRQIIVLDEVANLFLYKSQGELTPTEVQNAQSIVSKISRLGRSTGFHLIVATQRSDVASLDPQVKNNFKATLCFRTQNKASSGTIIGSGRAADLPSVPGRAIWKLGAELYEVQTPYMSTNTIENLIKPLKLKATKKKFAAQIKTKEKEEQFFEPQPQNYSKEKE